MYLKPHVIAADEGINGDDREVRRHYDDAVVVAKHLVLHW